MSLLLKQIFSFFKMLNSETGTNQIASGLSLGWVLGFSPLLSLQGLLILVFSIFLRVQMGAVFLAGFFFSFVAYLLDPVTDSLGRWVLESALLRPLFSAMYNMPIVPLTRFNNSIVMGSGIISLLLAFPSFFIFRYLVLKYRQMVVEKLKETRLWKSFAATGFYKWYSKYNELYN